MIQCHKDFDGVVHIGCDAPEIVVRTVKIAAGRRRLAVSVYAHSTLRCALTATWNTRGSAGEDGPQHLRLLQQ